MRAQSSAVHAEPALVRALRQADEQFPLVLASCDAIVAAMGGWHEFEARLAMFDRVMQQAAEVQAWIDRLGPLERG